MLAGSEAKARFELISIYGERSLERYLIPTVLVYGDFLKKLFIYLLIKNNMSEENKLSKSSELSLLSEEKLDDTELLEERWNIKKPRISPSRK